MSRVVVECPQQPFLMIPPQAHGVGAHFALKRENPVDAAFRVGPAINVVAQEDHGVAPSDLAVQLVEKVVQRGTVTVNVANCDGGHVATEPEQCAPPRAPSARPSTSQWVEPRP
jgi:hypothetical protein